MAREEAAVSSAAVMFSATRSAPLHYAHAHEVFRNPRMRCASASTLKETKKRELFKKSWLNNTTATVLGEFPRYLSLAAVLK